jgi:hypothetical protein
VGNAPIDEVDLLGHKVALKCTSCSPQHEANVQLAADRALNLAKTGLSRAGQGNNVSPHYTRWFGSWDSIRTLFVRNVYTSIISALEKSTIEIDCCTNGERRCNDDGNGRNVYAYVIPGSPYKIWLCLRFWRAPLDGIDSKSGTIVHEMAHEVEPGITDQPITQRTTGVATPIINPVPSTGTVTTPITPPKAYGRTAALSLLPNFAFMNADNYQYMAEEK